MICQVKKKEDGEIEEVYAVNGKNSIAYDGLLDIINNSEDISALQDKFRSWEGKHITSVDMKSNLALALYKQLYSPAFKKWFGNWEAFNKAKESAADIKGVYKDIFKDDPEQVLHEAAIQANSSASEKQGAISAFGENIVKDAQELYPNAKVGDPYTAKLDENGEPLMTPKVQDHLFNSEKFLQAPTQGTPPSRATPATLKKVSEFLARIGVTTKILQDLSVEGKKLGANGIADPLNALIQVTQGKVDVALTEEAMHMAVELIHQKNPQLFKSMMDRIGGYKLFDTTLNDYKELKEYQTADGKPDIPKLKKEAIAKVLAETIIAQNQDEVDSPSQKDTVRTWWQKIIDFLKGLFLRANFNPFEDTAEKISKGKEDLGKIQDLQTDPGVFLQKDNNIYDKLDDINKNIAKKDGSFEINGKKVENTVQKRVNEAIKKQYNGKELSEDKKAKADYRKQSEGNIINKVRGILDRFIGDDHLLRETPNPKADPSAIYNTLDNNIKQRLSEYEEGTKFFKDINVYDGVTAGNIDLMAITPKGKVDIFQFKVPEIYKGNTDIPRKTQELYNIEVDALRKILEKGYGVKKADFNLTRVLPIKIKEQSADFNNPDAKKYLKSVSIGSINTKVIQDDSLLPVAPISENTGNTKLNDILLRLRNLYNKMESDKVPGNERSIKAQRLKDLASSIRKLQIQKNIKSVLETGDRLITFMEDKLTKLSKQVEEFVYNPDDKSQMEDISRLINTSVSEADIYKDIHKVSTSILDRSNAQDTETLNKSLFLSDRADTITEKYINLGATLLQKALTGEFGDLGDIMKADKKLGYWTRNFMTQSQTPLKTGALLWSLAEDINHTRQFSWDEAKKGLQKLKQSILDSGLTEEAAQNLLLQKDSDGKFTGQFAQKISKEFYSKVRESLLNNDKDWVTKNIDTKAYNEWYDKNLKELKEICEENQYPKEQTDKYIQEATNRYSLEYLSQNNYMLSKFPKEGIWESTDYKKIKTNPAVLDLFNYWNSEQKLSEEIGNIESTNGFSYWPTIEKRQLERLVEGQGIDFLKSIRVATNPRETVDALTGKPIKQIHSTFNRTDLKPEERSFNLFKVIGLHVQDRIDYQLKSAVENIANLAVTLEAMKGMYNTNKLGKKQRGPNGEILGPVPNTTNLEFAEFARDAMLYGTTHEGSGIQFPLKKFALLANKVAGRTVIKVPETDSVTISLDGFVRQLQGYFRADVLGLNPTVPLGHIFGGSINTFITASGRFLDKQSILKAQGELMAGNFIHDDESLKRAALLSFIHPSLIDTKSKDIDKLSVAGIRKLFAGEDIYFMISKADGMISLFAGLAMIDNAIVVDGKIENARQYVTNKHKGEYTKGASEAKAVQKIIEAEIAEIKKGPMALVNHAKIVNGEITIPGIDKKSNTVRDLRQLTQEFIKNVLGSVTAEDTAAYHNSFLLSSMAQFKGWIFKLFSVHFQEYGFRPGARKPELGRWRMMIDFISHDLSGALKTAVHMLGSAGPTDSLLEAAAATRQKIKDRYSEEDQDLPPGDDEDFTRDFVAGVRKQFKEIYAALGLFGLIMLIKAEAPGKDEDERTKGEYKWALKAITKIQDRITVFYDPKAYSDMLNGSIISAVSMLVDVETLMTKSLRKTIDKARGDDIDANKIKLSPNVFRLFPILRQAAAPISIIDPDFAKEYGFKVPGEGGK